MKKIVIAVLAPAVVVTLVGVALMSPVIFRLFGLELFPTEPPPDRFR